VRLKRFCCRRGLATLVALRLNWGTARNLRDRCGRRGQQLGSKIAPGTSELEANWTRIQSSTIQKVTRVNGSGSLIDPKLSY